MTSAREAYEKARPGDHVIGWKVGADDRKALLARFPTRYARPIADHVTLRAQVDPGSMLPAKVDARIVGRADDEHGVEALIVEVDGGTERPDGGTYHITWSLAESRRAKDSNDVIAQEGWQPLPEPVAVHLEPASFR